MKIRKICGVIVALAIGVSGVPIAQAAPSLPSLPQQAPTLPPLPQMPPLPPLSQMPPLPAAPINLQPKPQVNQNVRETYLSFGDSVAANPTALDVAVYKTKKNVPNLEWPTIRNGSCAQDPNNFAVQAAKRTGLRLEDYSCPGATAYVEPHGNDAIPHDTVRQQVERAIADRKLDANTRLVTISAGVNDTYQPNNLPSMTTQPQRMARYDAAMTGAINRVKSVAPNAKVILLGIPDETDGHNHTCGSNLLGVTSHWYFPLVAYYQDEVREQQRLAALHTGSEFLDMVAEISVQSGKNGCSNDPGRYGASIFDDSPHKLAGHLTDAGHGYYGRRIAETYR